MTDTIADKEKHQIIRRTRASLRRIGHVEDHKINLARAGLLLARLKHPENSLETYLNHFKSITASVKRNLKKLKVGENDLRGKVRVLIDVIFKEYEYKTNHNNYDSLENANLMSMIDRRIAHPVPLTILFIHVAQQLKWHVDALNFPGHYLLRFAHQDEAIIINPFLDGMFIDVVQLRGMIKVASGLDAELKPSHYQAVGHRELLLRLQNNLKLHYIRAGEMGMAADTVDTMLWFAPNFSSIWYEGALLQARTGCIQKAKTMLESSLKCARSENDRNQIHHMLQQLQKRIR